MTRHSDTPSDPREQLLPYVLGELGDAERAEVERQLAADPLLATELESLERTSLDLFTAAPPLAPPPHLKDRVMASIAAATEHESRVAEAPEAVRERVPTPARASWWAGLRERLTPAPVLAGGFALACAVMAVMLVSSQSSLNDTRDQLQSARAAASASPQMRTVKVSDQLAGASGHLMRDGKRLVLVLEDMPSPGEGSWQIWTADAKGTVRNVGMWTGSGPTRAITIGNADQVKQVMVSHEHTHERMAAPSSAPVAAVTS